MTLKQDTVTNILFCSVCILPFHYPKNVYITLILTYLTLLSTLTASRLTIIQRTSTLPLLLTFSLGRILPHLDLSLFWYQDYKDDSTSPYMRHLKFYSSLYRLDDLFTNGGFNAS